jgi:DNA end-binding protein Ku
MSIEYRVALERVIEAKLGSGAPVTAAPAPPPGKVVDLMEALRASIQATKRARAGCCRDRTRSRASGKGQGTIAKEGRSEGGLASPSGSAWVLGSTGLLSQT